MVRGTSGEGGNDMEEKKKRRLRFSIKTLIACITIVAMSLGGWIAFSKFQIQKLEELRDQGVIVIVRDRTPQAFQSVGIKRLSPFFDVPTIELYVTPLGNDAKVGNSDELVSNSDAEELILSQAALARSYGAEDIQLGLVDIGSFDHGWRMFATENSLLTVSESKERYAKRLRANQESGANINP
jgi:hypothetical protein